MDELAPIFERMRQGDSTAVSQLIKMTQKIVVGRLFLYFRKYNFNNPWAETDFLTKTFIEDCISDVYAETVMNLHQVFKSSNLTRYFWGIAHNVLIDCLKKRYRYLSSHESIDGIEDRGKSPNSQIASDEDIPKKVHYKRQIEQILAVIETVEDQLTKDILLLISRGYKPREMLELLREHYDQIVVNKDNIYSRIRSALNALADLLKKCDKKKKGNF